MRVRQKALLSARSVPYVPKPAPVRDRLLLAFVLLMSAAMLAVIRLRAMNVLRFMM